MAAERPGKRACLDTFLFTSESVGEGHPGEGASQWLLLMLVFAVESHVTTCCMHTFMHERDGCFYVATCSCIPATLLPAVKKSLMFTEFVAVIF